MWTCRIHSCAQRPAQHVQSHGCTWRASHIKVDIAHVEPSQLPKVYHE